MILQKLELEEEKKKFLKILHHDKKGGQMIRLRINEKDSEQRSFCEIDELAATGTDTAGYYVTVNTFRGYKRESAINPVIRMLLMLQRKKLWVSCRKRMNPKLWLFRL